MMSVMVLAQRVGLWWHASIGANQGGRRGRPDEPNVARICREGTLSGTEFPFFGGTTKV